MDNQFLTKAQLQAEIDKCEYCAEKPCKKACPADCSPADFILAAKCGEKSDFKRAAALIMGSNPLGGVCGAVCPDWHCMKACSRAGFDAPVNIPAVQATIVARARELGVMPEFSVKKPNGKKVAVIGAGPAGLAAASVLAQEGCKVEIFEAEKESGGMCNLIPAYRLDAKIAAQDIAFVKTLGAISIKPGKEIKEPAALLKKDFDAVVVANGVLAQVKLNIPGENAAVEGLEFLRNAKKYQPKGKTIAVVGGGAVAADCAVTAVNLGAKHVEMYTRKNIGDIQLSRREMEAILGHGININGRSRLTEIKTVKGKISGISAVRLDEKSKDIKGTEHYRPEFDLVVLALKNLPVFEDKKEDGVFFAGDAKNGATTVVEAAASGKNTALCVMAFLEGKKAPVIEKNVKSSHVLPGRNLLPVPVDAQFFGKPIASPFLISAAPHSDGYEQVKLAYEAGWPGVVMKTAFDNVHIHIPSEYMFAFTQNTYANCDNVSGHQLDRVCREVERLRREFPDRLTMASTGGPVTGDDEHDKRGWQSNTRKLDAAGACGVEYSLSCPQGGDGTKGDIVSQDAELAAKIVDWVMEASEPGTPKLFKLTAAVTAIYPIIMALKAVFDKYPNKKGGVTLANSFPSLGFRKGEKKNWEEGVVVGMSGEGVIPISNLTLAKVSGLGVCVSGNGGPMDYRSAANFLALGAQTVQFCTIVYKYGYGVIGDLNSGLSHLMEERGIKSVNELIGIALPKPITDFGALTPVKKVSSVDADLCRHCGNCTRCPYLAISLDENKTPVIDPSRCIGCSICAKKCFAGALSMRKRSAKELAALKEE